MQLSKRVQIATNREIEYRVGLYNEYVGYNEPKSVDRLGHCQATIIHYDRFDALKSYKTIVAFYDKDSGMLCDVLRLVYGYTATSAKHIAKFRRYCNPDREVTWREVK